MDSIRIFLVVFVCISVIYPVEKCNAAGVSKHKQNDDAPCDICPRQGKCVPKVSCPAHVRSGSNNPECHLKNGRIGICCFTGRRHADPNRRSKAQSYKSIADDLRKKAHNASKAKLKIWTKNAQKILEKSYNTIVTFGSPEYGHQLSFADSDLAAQKLGEGAMLNLFALQDLRERHAIDDDDLALGYSEGYEGPYCPPKPTCPDPPSPYRCVNGECTNPDHPTWGAANTGYERLLPPDYSDGIWSLRTSRCCENSPLPSPRAISAIMLPDGHYPSNTHNMMFMQFCQFIAHDITSAVMHTAGNGSSISCCTKEGGHLPPEQLHCACAPIDVDPKDEFFSYFNKTCLSFVRVQLAPSEDCTCGYAKQMNGVTHVLDLSHLYGKTKEKETELRGPDGCMKVFNDYGRELPPLTDRPECLTTKEQSACFDSGDHHGNQLITLTGLHTIFTRLHNLIARVLRRLHPNCDADTIFYKTKAIVQAIYQHIIYNEWLPLLVGQELIEAFNLAVSNGYSSGYDPEVNPSLLTEFVTAAMRFGHSTVDGKIKITCPCSPEKSEVILIPELMFQPSRMRKWGFLDCLLHGMVTQPMQSVDPILTHGLTRYMFRGGNPFGLDLASLNIMRGRDFGNRPYNDYRRLCGLKPYESFDEFPPSASKRLSSVYECPEDIDLWIGGLLEEHVPGGLIGHTFAHIILEQFSRSKFGDRYHYDFGPDVNPGAFTPCELEEIKKMTIARVLCDTCDGIELKSMPPSAFLMPDDFENESLQCDDTTIPSMDLNSWIPIGARTMGIEVSR